MSELSGSCLCGWGQAGTRRACVGPHSWPLHKALGFVLLRKQLEFASNKCFNGGEVGGMGGGEEEAGFPSPASQSLGLSSPM